MFSSFFLPASLPNNSAPSLSNYTKSPILTESQLHQLSEDQHKLAAEMTLCALFIMYICVCVWSWVALVLAGTGVRDLQLKAILPGRPSNLFPW